VSVNGRIACHYGDPPQAVAERLGLTHPLALRQLEFHAAVDQVRGGRRAIDAMREFSIPFGPEAQFLFSQSVETAARNAVLGGRRVRDVAVRLGFDHIPQLVDRLERIAVDEVGRSPVQTRQEPIEVARRLDVQHLDNVLALF
jgi:hypothetical protein